MKYLIPLFMLLLLPALLLAAGEAVYPANPVLEEDAYFLAGAQGVQRLDPDSGRPVWWVLRQEQMHEPVLGRNAVLIGGASGVYALDKEDGRIRWHRGFASPAFSPVLYRGLLYTVTRDGWVRALSPEDGAGRWQSQPGDGWLYPPAAEGGVLITGGQMGVVWGLDAKTGEELWRREVGQELVYSPLAVGNHQVLITTFSGDVISLDSRDGRERWRSRFSTPSLNGSVAGALILLGSMDGTLRAIEGGTGRLLWQQTLAGRLTIPVTVHEQLLLAVTEAGDYNFLRLDTGQRVAGGLLKGDPVGGTFLGTDTALIFIEGRNNRGVVPVLVSANNVSTRLNRASRRD